MLIQNTEPYWDVSLLQDGALRPYMDSAISSCTDLNKFPTHAQ